MKNRSPIYNSPEPANAAHTEPHNHIGNHTEGWIEDIGSLTIWVLRVKGSNKKYVCTITEDAGGEGVEIGYVSGIEQARKMIDAIKEINENSEL